MYNTLHQIFVGTVATVLGTIFALLIWWAIEHRLPVQTLDETPRVVEAG